MRALVLSAPNGMTLRTIDDPLRPEECRVRVRLAGICGTDLQLVRGYAGFSGTPGHEFLGLVETVTREDDRRWIGRRVVGEINVGCGTCEWCARGVKEHCPRRTVLGIRDRPGAFADYLSLPAANLHAIPDSLSDEVAVFVEPTAAACQILTQVPVGPTTRVAVVGDGRMGLIVAQVLRTQGADVIVYGRHARKLSVAQRLGLDTALVSTATPTRTADVAVDVTGRPGGFETAMQLLRPRGTLVLKSTYHGDAPLTLWPVVVNEVSVVGSRCGPFSAAIELLQSGAIDVEPLVSAVLPLEDFAAAFDRARHELKVLLRP